MTETSATPGLRVHHAPSAELLVSALRECWAEPPRDVFDFDLAVVPGAGFQRWLSQQLAVAPGGSGVRAGVEFSTLTRLLRQLDATEDPWRVERLTWVLLRLAQESDGPALARLRAHLDAAQQPWSACTRIARLFAGYATHRPEMLAGWERGTDLGPQGAPLGVDAWQAELWRLAAAELGCTPRQRHQERLARLRGAPAAGVPARVAVLAARLQPGMAEVFEAMGTHHQVDLLALSPSPVRWHALRAKGKAQAETGSSDGGRPGRRQPDGAGDQSVHSRTEPPGRATATPDAIASGSAGGSAREVRAEYSRPAGHPLNRSLATVADEAALLLPAPRPAPRGPGRGHDRLGQAHPRLASTPATATPGDPGNPGPTPAPDTNTLLAWLQADLRDDTVSPPRLLLPDDDSVQFHLSHGLDRQVEVLREVLASLFAADSSLEPREIVVITPDVEAVAPLVTAAFGSGAAAHPGQSFRVQLADLSVARANRLVGLLLDLLQLPDSRLEASTLLALCAHEAVALRFGFTAENRDRLIDLVEQSGIRWGLSAAHRARFGLEGFPQNTWFAGIQRMLAGVAISERDLVTVGTTLPLDGVDSSDVELIGGLTELIGRLHRMLSDFETAATPAVWARRCRSAIESLVQLVPAQQWQLTDLWAGLSRFSDSGGDLTAVNRQVARRALVDQFGTAPARSGFGNGSLLVAGPSSLRHVPHRVVVLLGFDAERFPRVARTGGDDLLRAGSLLGDPDPALADRQLLLDCVHAARHKLIVVARGRSEATGEPVPLAAPVQELLDALNQTASGAAAKITTQHPLQPFDPAYFDPDTTGLRSVDPIAYRGALASSAPRHEPHRPTRLGKLTAWQLTHGVELDDLVGFFCHPARTLLRKRAGLSLSEVRESHDSMPLELSHLEHWHVGDRMLRRILAGDDLEAVSTAERLRGTLPPFDLGRGVLDKVREDIRSVLRRVPEWADTNSVAHDLAVKVDAGTHGRVELTGRVNSQAGGLLQVEYSSLQPKHRLATWLRLLTLTAAGQGTGRAVVIGKTQLSTLAAPAPQRAADLLGRYLAIYALGMTRPLPALPRLCAQWAALRAAELDPADPFVGGKRLARSWNWDTDPNWEAFFSYPEVLGLPADEVQLPGQAVGESSLVGALAQLIWEPLLAGEAGQ